MQVWKTPLGMVLGAQSGLRPGTFATGERIMQNVKITVKGDILTAEIDLSKKLGPSKSGKSINIATTGGNTTVEGHEGVKLGLNCYRSK